MPMNPRSRPFCYINFEHVKETFTKTDREEAAYRVREIKKIVRQKGDRKLGTCGHALHRQYVVDQKGLIK